MLAGAPALSGPFPCAQRVLPATLGAACATADGGGVVDLEWAIARPALSPPVLIDAIAGSRLLSSRHPANTAIPVTVRVVRGQTEVVLCLDERQRWALARLDGLAGGQCVRNTYLGTADVAAVVAWCRTMVEANGHRWPRAVDTLRTTPLRVTVPAPITWWPARTAITLVDTGVTDSPPPATVAAVVVLDYRDLLANNRHTIGLANVVSRWRAHVGAGQLVFAVDGIDRGRSRQSENLRYTVWQRTSQALGLSLSPDAVIPVSSTWALDTVSGQPRGQERSGIGLLVDTLAMICQRPAELLAAAVRRRLGINSRQPPEVAEPWGFSAEHEAARWARLYRTACEPHADRLRKRFDTEPEAEAER